LWSEYNDTTEVYFINNKFEGNDSTYFAKFDKDFTIQSDYNVLHRFKSYSEGVGKFSGTAHDIIADPLFIDDELHVDPSSPAIDNGARKAMYNFLPSVDIMGILRPQRSRYDMGAYEKE
jgi:hypothetical protein